jgi:uncharacterized membrane protein
MSGDNHYEGFLIIDNAWSVGLLVKHILIGLMIMVAMIMQMSVYPALERAQLLASKGDVTEDVRLSRRLRRLTAINLTLGILVLLITAVITAL